MKQTIITSLFVLLGTTLFAQTQNYWVRKADFGGLKRERAVAFTVNNKAYVGTGIDTAETVLKDFWAYDPTLDSWTQVADLPGVQRRNAVAFSIEPYGYVGTGMNAETSSEPGAAKLNDFWKYDPSINTWTQIANYPGGGGNGVYFATGFAIDSKGYVCCGKHGPNWYSSQVWEYKPSLDQWTQLPNFPGGVRYQLSSFVVGLKAYVGLGTDQDLYRNDIWEFNAATNQWTPRAPLPASERSAAMTFSIGSRGFVCMGTNGGLLDDLWEYNPSTDDWAVRATYGGSERKGGVGFSLNGKGYVGTGKGYSGKKQSMHEYHPYDFVGLSENEISWSIYPNPTSDIVKMDNPDGQIERFELISINGNLLSSAEPFDVINLQDYPNGMYYVRAIGQNNTVLSNKKLIKQ